MLVVVTIVLIATAAAVAVTLALRASRGTSARELQALRDQLDLLRESSEKSIQGVTSIFSTQMQSMNNAVQTSLALVSSDVGNRLDALNRNVGDRLNDNAVAMRSSSQEVNERIGNVQGTFANLQKQVGEITEQARQLGEVSLSMAELKNILSAPKLRGGFGETQLENLLAAVFPKEQFAMQYKFASGEAADAVLFFPQGMVAIDSKFSLENFRRILEAETPAARNVARKEFLRDVRKRIDETASYVRPADGTLPFALMYIPAENVYYEAIIRDEDGNDLYDYCRQRRVMPVSPNSLYAYLQTIMVGLNSMRITQRAEAVLREIQSLQVELEKFDEIYGRLGTHLKNATRSYEDSGREFDRLESRVAGLGGGLQSAPMLVEQKKAASSGDS
jgi:DNA recombination protein RmuC